MTAKETGQSLQISKSATFRNNCFVFLGQKNKIYTELNLTERVTQPRQTAGVACQGRDKTATAVGSRVPGLPTLSCAKSLKLTGLDGIRNLIFLFIGTIGIVQHILLMYSCRVCFFVSFD